MQVRKRLVISGANMFNFREKFMVRKGHAKVDSFGVVPILDVERFDLDMAYSPYSYEYRVSLLLRVRMFIPELSFEREGIEMAERMFKQELYGDFIGKLYEAMNAAQSGDKAETVKIIGDIISAVRP